MSILMISCSQTELLETKTADLPQDRISDLIGNFYQKVHKGTRVENNTFTIKSISTETFDIPDSLSTGTRTSSDSYDIHTVSVDFGETSGYVILSDTPEIDQIFYYTEAGSINDTIDIKPLKDMVENIPQIASDILAQDNETKDITTRSSDVIISPLVRFLWDQNPPFNNYATYCICDQCKTRGNHMPIGCVTIAVGQTIATLQKFHGTFYGNRDINFDNFPNYGYQFNTTQAMNVSHFLQEVALTCQIKFGCDGSSGTVLAAAHCLLDNGYKCDYKTGNLDSNRYIMNLREGLPHLIAGSSNSGGHMWILDGYIQSDGNNMYHINWGWGPGKSSGWASDKYYVTNGGTNYGKNMRHLYLGGVASK